MSDEGIEQRLYDALRESDSPNVNFYIRQALQHLQFETKSD